MNVLHERLIHCLIYSWSVHWYIERPILFLLVPLTLARIFCSLIGSSTPGPKDTGAVDRYRARSPPFLFFFSVCSWFFVFFVLSVFGFVFNFFGGGLFLVFVFFVFVVCFFCLFDFFLVFWVYLVYFGFWVFQFCFVFWFYLEGGEITSAGWLWPHLPRKALALTSGGKLSLVFF